jgi:hypothetical protein
MRTENMATKPKRAATQVIDNAQLELALESTLNAALTAAAIFCHQYETAQAAEHGEVRAFLEREYALTLLIATDPCTDPAAFVLGHSEELVEIVNAAQEVAEYASTWFQIRRLGRAVVGLSFAHSITHFDLPPLEYTTARTARLRGDLLAIVQRPSPGRRLKIAR